MEKQQKLRVAVIYGGRSAEHEISKVSGAFIVKTLLALGHEVLLIGIDEEGGWYLQDSVMFNISGALDLEKKKPIFVGRSAANLSPSFLMGIVPFQKMIDGIDVIFPIVHGTYGEDGCLQGLCELLGVPYVGSGVLASALCMDKEQTKNRVQSFGIPVVPSITVHAYHSSQLGTQFVSYVQQEVGFPCFLKAASLGSSVGVYKVHRSDELLGVLQQAFQYDEKVLIEKAVNAREIEVAVLESTHQNDPPIGSLPGEIVPHHEFYSYDAKYNDPNGASFIIPAHLTREQEQTVQKLAVRIFQILGCQGMARVDFFLDKDTGQWFLNEVNTIPGFTSISMYPKLMEYSGFSAQQLIGQLIQLAIDRQTRKECLQRTSRVF